MPVVLKQRTPSSPGIISFTHNEVLNGVPARSQKVKRFLKKKAEEGHWIFGVHVQGDCNHMASWPLESWHHFLMWPDKDARFLNGVPRDRLESLTCINFMPSYMGQATSAQKKWDLCIISRASHIKRIEETMLIVRKLLSAKPDLKVVFIVPDMRKQSLGNKTYRNQGIEQSFFESPLKMFSCEELKNLNFMCTSQEAFGNFPLSSEMVSDILNQSKFLLLTSHKEGVPRVIAESLLVGTPCIVSEKLQSGITQCLDANNSLSIEDDPEAAATRILEALSKYSRYKVDREQANFLFSEHKNLKKFRSDLEAQIVRNGYKVEGEWFLNELYLRLACHGQKSNYQFMNRPSVFFEWFERIERAGSQFPSEDYCFGPTGINDLPRFLIDSPTWARICRAPHKILGKIISLKALKKLG